MLEPKATRARSRTRGRRRERRTRFIAWGLRALVLALVFFAGLVIGKALEQSPESDGTQTRLRTLEPRAIAPRERTITVTTTQ
jgi:flagellar biogenesis protein FliO